MPDTLSPLLSQVSPYLQQLLASFPSEDYIVFQNKKIKIDKNNFQPITPRKEEKKEKTLAFIDGGQAEILSAANFCLSFLRLFAQTFDRQNRRLNSQKNEFYLLTYAQEKENKLFYFSKVFPFDKNLIEESDLLIDSNDETIRNGLERAPVSKIASLARRFAELSLASQIQADFVLLDGTLTPTFKNEEKYLAKLSPSVSALAKTSSLFTPSGNSPLVLLNKASPFPLWSYFLANQTYFVKLHEKAWHIFRFEGAPEVLPYLVAQSQDPLFLGYPYGLIFADRFARISNQEKDSLKTQFLLHPNNRALLDYLATADAHNILDNLS